MELKYVLFLCCVVAVLDANKDIYIYITS